MSTEGNESSTCCAKEKKPKYEQKYSSMVPIDVEGIRVATPGVVERGGQIERRVG